MSSHLKRLHSSTRIPPAYHLIRRFPGALRVLALLWLGLPLSACGQQKLSPSDVSIAGLVPPLAFTMTDVATGKTATEADFRGQVVLLYFGYTNCPDVCPDTLAKMDSIFAGLGPLADQVTFLFVTVDPYRDAPSVLSAYTSLFGPHVVGLRGNADQLFRLARRYRVVFTVHRSVDPLRYEVMHSSSIYVFSTAGQGQFLISQLGTGQTPDIGGITDDIRRLIVHPPQPTILERIAALG